MVDPGVPTFDDEVAAGRTLKPLSTVGRPTMFPRTAADAVCLRPSKTRPGYFDIILIKRLKETFHGKLAFPGGHIDYNEDPEVACVRELEEETTVKGTNPQLLTVKGKPGRDPRYHMISIVYLVDVDPEAVPQPKDDAMAA